MTLHGQQGHIYDITWAAEGWILLFCGEKENKQQRKEEEVREHIIIARR